MSSKRQFAEQVHRRLSGGDPTTSSKFDDREIMLVIGQYADQFMQDYLYRLDNSRQKKNFIIPREYLKKVPVTLTSNVGVLNGINYPLSLPSNRTVYEVRTQSTTVNGCNVSGETVYPMTISRGIADCLESVGLIRKFEVRNLSDPKGVEIEVSGSNVSAVDVWIVPSSACATEDEELVVHTSLEPKIIEATIKHFIPQLEIPHDNKQDNSEE